MNKAFRWVLVLIVLWTRALQSPGQCFFADDYSNPAAWTVLPNPGFQVGGGAMNFNNTRGGTVPGAMRGAWRALPNPLPNGGGWRADIDLFYNQCGDNSGLLSLAFTAGTRQPLNEFPNGVLTRTPQDFIGIIHTGPLGSRAVPIKPFFSDDGTWGERANPMVLPQGGTTTYLRLERLNATMVKLSAFADAARSQPLPGSPACLVVPASVQDLTHVWHANLPQGSFDRNDNGFVDNLCLSTIPVLDTTFRVQADRVRLCLGDTVRLTSTASDYAPLAWSEASTGWTATGATATFVPSAPGLYTLVASGELRDFCLPGAVQRVVRVQVEAPDSAVLNYPLAAFCRTGTAAPAQFSPAGGVFSGTPGLVIDPATGQIDLAASSAGPHTVTYVDSRICATSASFGLTITPLTTASVAYPSTTFCQNQPTPVPVFSPAGGTFTATGGLSVNLLTGALSLANTPPGTYTVTYTGPGSCAGRARQTITVQATPFVTASYPLKICRATTTTTAPSTFAPAGGTFSGSPGLVIDPSTGIINVQATPAGLYSVTYTIASACTASVVLPLQLADRDTAILNYGQTTFCRNGYARPVAISPAGTFSWQVPPASSALVFDVATGVINLRATPPGTYSLTLVTSGPCPAQRSATITILNTQAAAVTYLYRDYCAVGQTVRPQREPDGGQFSGTPGLVLDSGTGVIDLGASAPGAHTVTYTAGSCSVVGTFRLTIHPIDVASLAYPAVRFCGDAIPPVPRFGPPGGSFAGSPGLVVDSATGQLDLAGSRPGAHVVTYTSAGYCPQRAEFSLQIDSIEEATLLYPDSVLCGSAAVLPRFTPAGGTFSGAPGLMFDAVTGAVELRNTQAGTYQITYRTAGPCPAEATARLVVRAPAPPRLPNVLTPNGDGLNDELTLHGFDLQAFRLQVFNRWGREVWSATAATAAWRPTDVAAGTYYYLLRQTDCSGQPRSYKGWIEVVK